MNENEYTKDLEKFTNILIDKVTRNLERFHLNVVIANFYETYNYLNKILEKNINNKVLEDNYYKILQLIYPVIPHIASECINDLGKNLNFGWPAPIKTYLVEQNVDIVIQINGKKRGLINIEKGSNEESITNKAFIEKNVKKYIENKKIIKKIYVKDRLLNLIIK